MLQGNIILAPIIDASQQNTRVKRMLVPINTTKPWRLFGLGNALVDILAPVSENFITEQQLAKGMMTFSTPETIATLYQNAGQTTLVSGGSVANSMVGFALLGGKAAYFGRVQDDDFGRLYRHDMTSCGVDFIAPPMTSGELTGRSLVLITPDGQRTMQTYLGAAVTLGADDYQPRYIENAACIFIEGYLFYSLSAQNLIATLLTAARQQGVAVALTLSDPLCVQANRAVFWQHIRAGIDILLGNEDELCALAETTDLKEALRIVQPYCRVLVATRSARGSIIIAAGQRQQVEALNLAPVVDTTGAGDLYAAGLLYGVLHGMTVPDCGRLASLLAAEVITHFGARPQTCPKTLCQRHGITLVR